MNKTNKILITWTGMLMSLTTPVMADVIVYPAKGQSPKQMEQDKYQCYGWAKNNSGFDPMQATSPSAHAQQSTQQRGLLRGGARGAALGAVGGAIGGDAGTGAAIGAATGAMIGGMRRRDSRRQQDQANAQSQPQYQAAKSNYDRAYAVCLEGRGYSVR